METFLKILLNPATQVVLFAILGLSIKGFIKYRTLVKELMDVVKAHQVARATNSPGGKKITQAEWAAIGKECVDVIQAASLLLPQKKVGV